MVVLRIHSFNQTSLTPTVRQATRLALRWRQRCQDEQGRTLTASGRKRTQLLHFRVINARMEGREAPAGVKTHRLPEELRKLVPKD